MTAEEKKIARLERELEKHKGWIKDLEEEKRQLNDQLVYERQWRRSFQRLMKTAVQEDNLQEDVFYD